ncbi:MAG: glycosyltransferase [Isosphaeraceae bacterium]|nr:glycosyltransferase [Isosphaeraceae bacterium]
MNRILVFGTDSNYFEYTIISLHSFLRHNPGWPVLVMDVGMTPEQARALSRLARIVRYPREDFHGTGRHIPSAKARCLALAHYPNDDTLMLYLDGDSVIMGSLEPLIERFLNSGRPIGIAKEDNERFFMAPVHRSWENSEIPAEFPNSEQWRDRPVLNTGVLLALGARAAEVGARASALYETLKTRFQFGEQTIINSVIYEEDVPTLDIEAKYHCFVHERYLEKTGRPYVDPVLLDGEPVVLRHFCHANKEALDSFKPDLLSYYGSMRVEGAIAPARRVLGVFPDGYFLERDSAAVARRVVMEVLVRQGLAVEVLSGSALDPGPAVEPAHWLAERNLVPESSSSTAGAEPAHLRCRAQGVSVTLPVGLSTRSHEPDEAERESFLRLFEAMASRTLPDVVLVAGASWLARDVMARAKARGVASAFLVDRLDRFPYRDPVFFADADAVLTPSRYAAGYMHEALGLSCTALPPPVDHARVRAERNGPGYLTFVDPTYENGVYAVARIAEELGRRRPDIRLLIVERTATVEGLAAAGVDLGRFGNITVQPHSPDHREFWSQTRVLLAPTLGWETPGFIAIEALVNGIPVIGSDRGDLAEVLGPDGIVLPLPGRLTPALRVSPPLVEVAAWVEAVIRLWDDGPFYAEQRRHALAEARRWAPEALEPEYARLVHALRPWCLPLLSSPPKRAKAAVLVPHLNGIEPECEQNLDQLERFGVQVIRRIGSSQIDVARNEMMSEALHQGAESILFIDADMGFNPLDALRLLARPEPVIAGIYSKKARRELTSVFAEGVPEVTFGQEDSGAYPLRYAATGFLRIKAEVLWRMIAELRLPLCNTRWGKGVWPFFHPMIVPMGDESLHYLGEDWAFSHRLGLIGVVPVADASFRLYHWGRYGYSWEEAGGDHPRYRTYTLRF